MAITTTNKTYYDAGVITTSSIIVGYEGGSNRVVRLTFTTNDNPYNLTGASSLSWSLGGNYKPDDASVPTLRWYVGTSSTSHINAGISTTEYHGNVTATNNSGEYTFSGSADIILLPNTTYYLWIFPSVEKYSYYHMSKDKGATVTLSGSAGLVHIDDGTGFNMYQAYIDNGTGWDLYMPYIDNGTGWDLCN